MVGDHSVWFKRESIWAMGNTDLHLAPTQGNGPALPHREPVPFDPASLNDSYIGRYFVKRLLGKGGFGYVYLAVDEQLNRNVAIKIPHAPVMSHSSEIQMHLAEARAVANLDHPYIVPVYDVGSTPEFPFFVVSKFIDGSDLATLLRQRRFAPRQVAEMIAAIAEGLHCAHKQGLVHRDIKPANILIDQDSKAYIVDFGIALREHEDVGVFRFAGTPAYMSPEQVRSEGHRVDERSDLFSLGVIFYELLSGSHPFQSSSQESTLEKIATLTPVAPSLHNPTVPLELDRICLRSLEKLAADRYATAKEMADDLSRFVTSDSQQTGLITSFPTIRRATTNENDLLVIGPSSEAIRVAPKGLRSFDANDAGFFLDLLPGPRDREGLPESIRFWKSRIESNDQVNSFAVGLIYGPSGCGKSSFVKAGLLPRLQKSVFWIYVESTGEETELRLRQRLQKCFPELPGDLSLPEAMSAIRRGKYGPLNGKVLIVIDQFEQWLHATRTDQNSELINALRQCDGERLQAIVMARDDFWMPVTRFVRELDSRFWDGQNSGTLDLFSLRHAESVLAAFGRAYGTLPEKSADLTQEQQAFLTQSVQSLAEDGKVICVRLALFADMMKSKPWTPLSLREIGGANGVGIAFLEDVFGSAGAPPENRFHQVAVRQVLSALLPKSGTNIKGTMRSYVELQEAAGYLNRPNEFRELIRILDSEVRLITPTDPDAVVGMDPLASDPVGGKYSLKYYQLSHDYLVPPLRSWLTSKQQETRKGQAELRLAERSAIWNAKPEERNLPSLYEFLTIRSLTSPKEWTSAERRTMSNAAFVHGRRTSLISVMLLLMAIWGTLYVGRLEVERKENYAKVLVKSLLTVPVADVPKIIGELQAYEKWAMPMLHQAAGEFDDVSRERIRISLVLLRHDPAQVPFLVERMLTAKTEDVLLIASHLESYHEQIEPKLWEVIAHPSDQGQLIRAAVALADYVPDDPRWKEYAGDVANALLQRSRASSKLWIDFLRPLSSRLVPVIRKSFAERHPDRKAELPLMALALAEYQSQDPEALLQTILLADDGPEYQPLFEKLRMWKGILRPRLRDIVKQPIDPSSDLETKIKAWKRIANASVCLAEMVDPGAIRPLLVYSSDPSLRSLIIHRFNQFGLTFQHLSRWFDVEKDASIRQALILAMGSYNETKFLRGQRETVQQKLLTIYKNESDSGTHAAARWMLKQWGADDEILEIDQEKWGKGDQQLLDHANRTWSINSQGQQFVVIRNPGEFPIGHDNDERNPKRLARIDYDFAMGTHEVTVEQYRRFHREESPLPDRFSSGIHPMNKVSWYMAVAYCNWLSEQEGIPQDQWCYEPNAAGEYASGTVVRANCRDLLGYRLPFPEEWEYCCRSGSTTDFYFGDIEELLSQYGWWFGNSANHTWPIGMLKPNDFGFFDMHGNLHEWSSERASKSESYEGDERTKSMVVALGSSISQQSLQSKTYLQFHRTQNVPHPNFGLRVVRTIPTAKAADLSPNKP